MTGQSIIKYNGKNYNIDNLTGKISLEKFSLKEQLFNSTKNTIENISKVISDVNEFFESRNHVKYHAWGISGFTEKGSKIIEEAKMKAKTHLKLT